MTTNRDPDRILRAWLDLMPDEAPDRVLSAVSQAVATTPQVRRPLAPVFRRFPQMNRLSIAVAAAATLVVAIVGASLILKPSSNVGAPSPTPQAVTSPSPTTTSTEAAAGPVPAQLQARWMSGHRAFADPGAGTSILFAASTYSMHQSNDNPTSSIAGSVGSSGADELRFPAGPSYPACDASATGLYRWTLSPSGRVLTLTTDTDNCATRAADLAGTYWRMGCRDANTNCLGELDAGTYASQYITPLLAPGAEWGPLFGGLTYTVPDGWANHSDYPGSFSLSLATDFAQTTTANLDPAAQILALTDVVPDQVSQCSSARATAVPTAAGVVAWLADVPGIDTGASTTASIGGRSAVHVDLTFDPTELASCGNDQIVEYLQQGNEHLAIGLGERQRLILVDVGAGEILAIRLEVADTGRFDAFVAAAMPIVESFQFK